jgi:integrase
MIREKGTGSIFQREQDGMWVARLELPSDGTKRRRKTIVRKNKADAIAALREAKKDLERAGDLATSSPTLEQWMNQWLDRIAAPRLKPNTLVAYRGSVTRYIVPSIGNVRLDKLTPQHVRKMHDYARQGRSSTTALQAHRVLAKALTDAEREGRVTRNVATLVDAPAKAHAVRDALTADDARRLLLHASSNALDAAMWSVALLAGLRQGERLGLTRDAVDLDTGIITVSWQLQRLKWEHGCGGTCGKARGGSCPDRTVNIPAGQEAHRIHGGLWHLRPKSRAGWRQVPIAPLLHEVLTRYLDDHQPGDRGLIFTRPDGHPIDPSDDTAAWDQSLRDAGLPDVVLHSARHTTATLLHALGADEQTRMQILGHSSATVTAGYTHIANSITADYMGRLGDLLRPQLEP